MIASESKRSIVFCLAMLATLLWCTGASALVISVDVDFAAPNLYTGLGPALDDAANTTWNHHDAQTTPASSTTSNLLASDGSATTISSTLSGTNVAGNLVAAENVLQNEGLFGATLSFEFAGLDPNTMYDLYVIGVSTPNDITVGGVTKTLTGTGLESAGNPPVWEENKHYAVYTDLLPDVTGTISGDMAGVGNNAILTGLQITDGSIVVVTESTWLPSGSGDWNFAGNWAPNVIPAGNNRTAIFGASITSPQTVFTNTAVTIKTIQFGLGDPNNPTQSYAISGQGSLNLEADSGNAGINVLDGSHQFQAVVNLNNTTDVSVVDPNAILVFNNALNLGVNDLNKTGAGTMEINNILNSGGGDVSATAGVVSGSGLISGDLDNTGATVAPGNSPGTLSVGGNYTQTASGTLAIEIAGLLDEEFDLLDIAGAATLDGILDISLLSFTPSPNDSFTVLSAALGITDNGITLAGDMANDFSLSLANGDTDLVLTFQAGIAGDFDADGDVDGADFLLWQRDMNVGDLADWEANYGTTSPMVAAATAVPEPASAGLLVGAIGALALARRRRK